MPPNLENLKPWKPGQSGNPAGKPKGRSVTARLRDLLDAVELGGKPVPDGKQVADLLAEVILKNALKGDHRFVSTVLDRTEGKVADKTDGEPNGNPDAKPRIIIPGSAGTESRPEAEGSPRKRKPAP
jgi:hypothetical protein